MPDVETHLRFQRSVTLPVLRGLCLQCGYLPVQPPVLGLQLLHLQWQCSKFSMFAGNTC